MNDETDGPLQPGDVTAGELVNMHEDLSPGPSDPGYRDRWDGWQRVIRVIANSGETDRATRIATYNTGIWSNLIYGRTFTPSVVQQNAKGIAYSSGWSTASQSSASGGSVAYTHSAGASVKFTASASSIAWIGNKAHNHGVAKLYVDGRYVGSEDSYASATQSQEVLFRVRFSSTHTHTIQIVDTATSGRPYVDADAFVITR